MPANQHAAIYPVKNWSTGTFVAVGGLNQPFPDHANDFEQVGSDQWLWR